jgi:membrane protease YdiL (CAAX protease family)
MKKLLDLLQLRTFCPSEKRDITVLLILAALIPALHRGFGSIEFARRTFPSVSAFGSAAYMFIAAFVLMGIIPLVIIRCVFREDLRDYGMGVGDWRKGLPATAALLILISVVLLLPSSQTGEIRSFYPFDKNAADSIVSFFRFEALRVLFFYTAWEFFFRGFLLFGLRRAFGDWEAILIQTIPSCLWHIGMPTGEILGSIAGGILFGVLALRTRSILWVFLLHSIIGVVLDVFIITIG